MKIYVITSGCYSDYHICAVTLDKEKAEAAVRTYSDINTPANIEEYDDEDIKIMNQGEWCYRVIFNCKGDVLSIDKICGEYYTGEIRETLFSGRIVCEIIAKSEKAAVKIAAEKRAMYLAHKENID